MPEPPACQGPDPHPRPPQRYVLPPGAVDTHAHVIGSPPTHPFVPDRSYTPPPAAPAARLAMLDAIGLARGVLVQVSVHGTDNSLLQAALRASPARLRGIAVMPLGRPASEYQRLRDAGVVGLRLNVLFGGGIGLAALEEYGALCRDFGWHLQFLLDARDLPAVATRLARLPVPAVIDHMGHLPAAGALADRGFQTLLGLVGDGVWVKLSGAYRLSAPPYAEAAPLARTLLAAGLDRCVWGSDWPHVAVPGAMPNVGDLLDLLADWAPDAGLRQQILVDNPGRLYGFAPMPKR